MKKTLLIIALTVTIIVSLLAIYEIRPSSCNNCGRCVSACDDDAIYFDTQVGKYQIDPELCTDCGDCVSRCPRNAIHQVPVSNDDNQVEALTIDVNVFPNPTSTKAVFKVFTEAKNTKGNLDIFNLKGQKVRSFKVSASNNVVAWDLTSESGNKVPSGSYFYKFITEDKTITKLLTVIK